MIYLNYAALCPTHPEAEREVEGTLAEFKQYLYSDAGIQWYLQKSQHCREKVAKLLNVQDPSTIAFVPNASTANSLVLSSLVWNPGDAIVTSTHENPSIIRELRALAQRGVQTHTVKPTSASEFVTAIDRLTATQKVKAIVLSHVSHVDGRVFPLQEVARIAREKEILFIIDGAQAVGHIPVDVSRLEFDIYFFTGHKWCRGPLGTGALVVHDHFLQLNPMFGLQAAEQGHPRASQFEIGTHNIGLIAGLAKACEVKHEEGLGTERLEHLKAEVNGALDERGDVRILKWDGPHAPGILTFQGPPSLDHHEMVTTLSSQWNIVVKPFWDYPEGETPAIRLSWSPATKEQDIRFVLEKIGDFLGRK